MRRCKGCREAATECQLPPCRRPAPVDPDSPKPSAKLLGSDSASPLKPSQDTVWVPGVVLWPGLSPPARPWPLNMRHGHVQGPGSGIVKYQCFKVSFLVAGV